MQLKIDNFHYLLRCNKKRIFAAFKFGGKTGFHFLVFWYNKLDNEDLILYGYEEVLWNMLKLQCFDYNNTLSHAVRKSIWP